MIKKNLKTILLTSLITFVPMLTGLLLWNRLPESIATHFGADNLPNGWSSKPFTVFAIPLILFAIHILCICFSSSDPKRGNISEKLYHLVLWIIPATSLLLTVVIYPNALGKKISVGLLVIAFMGMIFILIGNYLPKCRKSYTLGIRLPWTLESSENWNKTHNFTGKLWVVGGLAMLVTSFLENVYIFGIIAFLLVLLPTFYSYRLYRQEKGEKKK